MNNKNLKIFSSNLNTCRDAKTRSGIMDVLKRHSPDIWLMQEVNVSTEELQSLVQNSNYNAICNILPENENSRGTAILWKNTLEVKNVYTIEECRVQTAKIGALNLVNVYAPSGNDNKLARREFFGQTVMHSYRSFNPSLPIMGGDMNCVLGNNDARNNANQKKCETLRMLVNNFNLKDAFRHFYPNLIEYTFHRANSASRLDRFYIPTYMIPNLKSICHHPQSFSDHCIVEMIIQVPDVQSIKKIFIPRSSYWKMNTDVIDDDFVENFVEIYAKAREYIDNFDDIADWWEYKLKPMFRFFCKSFSIHKSTERKSTKDFLNYQLRVALNNGRYSDVLRLKSEINKILIFEANGIKIRSRFQENAEEEKGSLFHMNREIKRAKENNVEKLLIDQVVETDPSKCKKEAMSYFTALFSGKLSIDGDILDEAFEMNEELLEDFLTDKIAKLTEADKEALERPFVEEELESCIKKLPRNKTPGLDGLPFEVYKKVFPIIKQDYLAFQNCITEREKLTNEMRKSVTRVTPKITEGVPTVKQLRPLSMQISDYSIRNRMIAARMTSVMPSILKSGQLCNQTEKNILFGITNMISTIEYVNQEKKSAAIASFDMDHAFDRAFIPYILKVLKHMNFGDKFIRLMKDTHHNITTRLILNSLTDEIRLTFSFRQGDPISMILYLIYVEPLLIKLGELLQGFHMANFTELDNDFCDDVELMVEDENDLVLADEIFTKFSIVSGALLNRSHKSKIMGIGGWTGRELWPLPWLKVEKSLKIFGVHIYPTYRQILNENWSSLLLKLRNTLFSWNLRSLDTFKQRVDVVQIFATSKLWYVCQALPLPAKFAKKFEALIRSFIWTGKLEKLALDEIKNNREEGGLGVVCIRSKADALFLRQTCRLIASPQYNSFQHVKYWVGLNLGEVLPDMQPGAHAVIVPEYFQHLQKLFLESHALEIINIERLNSVPAKKIYEDFTSSFPHPKVIYKYENLPWNDIWVRLNHPVLTSKMRDIMFLVIHNILPTRDRLHRLNMSDNAMCKKEDGLEDVEHLFTGCLRTQVAWAWTRRKIMHLLPDWVTQFPSNFELLHLAYEALLNREILWLISTYCSYVWIEKIKGGNNYMICVDKLRNFMMQEYQENQYGQNSLAFIPF